MEGIDKCRFVGGNRAGRRPSTSRPITTTTSSVTEKSTLPVTIRQAPALPESEEEEVVDEETKRNQDRKRGFSHLELLIIYGILKIKDQNYGIYIILEKNQMKV